MCKESIFNESINQGAEEGGEGNQGRAGADALGVADHDANTGVSRWEANIGFQYNAHPYKHYICQNKRGYNHYKNIFVDLYHSYSDSGYKECFGSIFYTHFLRIRI